MKINKRNLFASVFGVMLLTLFAAFSVVAQVTTGSVAGVVRDPNGAVVAGATVRVTNTETGQTREVTTNESGFYRVTNLIPGERYQVEVNATGFTARTIQNVNVRLGTENSVDVELSVGGVGGVVTVTDDSALINSTENQLSTSYSEKQIQQLPLNGGLIDNIALLTPGVVTPGDADFTNGVGISANGNRGRSNNFQLDGQDNNDNSVAGPSLFLTNTEAIGDYQVTTNNPSAEFGRNAGAQINVITRSGTNQFHGSIFEYYQNDRMVARNNIAKQRAGVLNFLVQNGFSNELGEFAARNGRNPFDYHRFGGALGGPIKKDRAFFFFTFQRDHQNGEFVSQNLGSGGITFTPQSVQAAANRGFLGAQRILANTNVGGGPAFANVPGRFLVVPAMEDTNGDGVPDAFVTGSLYNSLFICNITPAAGAPCPAANRVPLQTGEVIRIAPNNFRESQFITREDINLTQKDSLVFRYVFDKANYPDTPAVGSTLSGAFFDVPSKNHNFGATWTRIFSPRFTNEFRFNFSRLDVKFGDPEGTLPGPGITFNGQRDLAFNFTSLNFGTANNLPQSRKVDVYQQQDTVRATLGNHSLSMGIDLRQQRVENFFLPNFLGVYRFGSGGSIPAGTFFNANGCDRRFVVVNANCALPVDPDTGETLFIPNSAVAFENLLLGRFNRVNFALGNPRIETSQNDYFFFIQDNWRVRPSLTLNLGLRYEYSTTPFNPIIEQVIARESNSSTAIFNTAFPLETRTPRKLPTDKNNFAPRLGFAWTPSMKFLGDFFENKQTVIRGGFGIAYDPSYFNIVLNTVTAAPFAAAGQVVVSSANLGSLTFPFLPSTTAELNTTPGTNGGDPRLFNQTRVDPNFYSPYSIQFNLGVQQELWKNTVLEVRYVGTRLVGQFQTVNANPNLRLLNQIGQCFGLAPGTYTNGVVVGSPAGSQSSACFQGGFNNRTDAGTNGNGRIDPNFGNVRLRTNGARGTYDGLQVRFDTRFSNLIFNANYSLSKTMDNASEIFSTFGGGQTVAHSQNPFNTVEGEWGLSAFHQKHNFTSNFIYELPFYRDQQGVVGKLLGGFQLSGIIRMGSGRPYTPTNIFGMYDPGWESAFVGSGSLRPYNGNPSAPNGTIAFGYTSACFLLFNDPACSDPKGDVGMFVLYNTLQPGSVGRIVTAQEALQQARLIYNDSGIAGALGLAGLISLNCNVAIGPFGCAEALTLFKTPYGIGRNTFSGEPFYSTNMAIFKTTNFTDRYRLELRLEAANLFNERNFGVPDPFTEDAFFSVAVGSFQNPGFNSGSSRQLRFGVRFLF